jgi:hypothetical protein
MVSLLAAVEIERAVPVSLDGLTSFPVDISGAPQMAIGCTPRRLEIANPVLFKT